DAVGVTGCSGAPTVCAPLWTDVVPTVNGASSPVVVGGTLYVASLETLYAFDAAGTTGCSGSPKVCQPLWSAPGISTDIVVGGGKVFVFDPDSVDGVLGYDAAGTAGCSGSPKVCAPTWRGTVPDCEATIGCGRTGAMMAVNGRLYEQLEIDGQEADFVPGQAWFDEAGSVGCSGSTPSCVGTIGARGLAAAGPGGATASLVSASQSVGPDPLINNSAATVDVTDPSSNLIWSQTVQTAPPGARQQTTIGKPAVAGPTTYLPVGTGIQAWAVDQPTSCT